MNFSAIIGLAVSAFIFALLWGHKSATIRTCINKDPDYLVKNINIQYLDIISRILLWFSALWFLMCLFTVSIPSEWHFQSIGSAFIVCGYILSASDREEASKRAIIAFTKQLEIEKEKNEKQHSEYFY